MKSSEAVEELSRSRLTLMQSSDQWARASCTTDLSSSLEIVIAWFYQIQETQPQHWGATWARYLVTPILFRKLGFQAILHFTTHQIEPQWQSRNSRNLPNTFFKSFQSISIFPNAHIGGHCLLLFTWLYSSAVLHSMSRSGFGLKLGAGWLGPVLKSPPHVHFR